MSVAIIGNGVVGGVLKRWFDEKYIEHLVFDPPKGQFCDISKIKEVFICVPVPTKDDGTQDYSTLEESIALCADDADIYIRSTVLPGIADAMAIKYGKFVYSMPEFLTERIAYEEFKRLPILVGNSDKALHLWPIFQGKEVMVMSNTECEMAKYVHNCFGAAKVNFFNHVYNLCKKENIDYQNVLRGTFMSGFVDHMYTQVPGPDGEFGYGGKCFPKDMHAFATWAGLATMKFIHKSNIAHRKNGKTET